MTMFVTFPHHVGRAIEMEASDLLKPGDRKTLNGSDDGLQRSMALHRRIQEHQDVRIPWLDRRPVFEG